MDETTQQRKNEHIHISLNEEVNAKGITTGLEQYRFRHNALPEIDFKSLDLTSQFLGKKLRVPLLISSMTGGTPLAREINERLATMAETRGWAMGLGSIRAAIENEQLADTFRVRRIATSIPLFANLGAVQLNYGYSIEQCRKAIDMIEADGLVLHLNSIQEVFQPEGNTNFSGLLSKIEKLCRSLDVPIGVKEVGWGIHADVAAKLNEVGVSFIDVAGAGGTSWSQVEKYRLKDPVLRKAAEAFTDWGNCTADCIIAVRNKLPRTTIIGSGGINDGVDAAKAICLGADLIGFGRALLQTAVNSLDELDQLMNQIELELKIAMFGAGVQTIEQLKHRPQLFQ